VNNLRAATKDILRLVADLSGRSVQLMRDDTLKVFSTLVTARHGSPYHVLRYQPSNDPLDYWFAYQAGFLIRLFNCPPESRFDFVPDPDANQKVLELIGLGRKLPPDERETAKGFADVVAQWALMNLRSLSIGMRVDAWIAETYPTLRELQAPALERNLQSNLNVIGQRLGKLSVPSQFLGMDAAYALFAERLLGTDEFTIPYEAAGALDAGRDLLAILDATPAAPDHDCELVDRWAQRLGMNGWYRWQPYEP
jgi:hypothetical protein